MKSIDTRDMILTWLKTNEEERPVLSEKQSEIFRRVMSCVALSEQHRLDKDVVDIHMALEKENHVKISRAQAYRDLDIAKYIRGDLQAINRKFDRLMMRNWQMESMQRTFSQGNDDAFNKGMANLIKIVNPNGEDNQLDPEDINPVRPMFGFFTELFEHVDLPETPEELEADINMLIDPPKYKKKEEENYDGAADE